MLLTISKKINMGLLFDIFEIIGAFIRWIIEYRCTTDKEKLKELDKDQSNKSFWYGVLFCIIIILIFSMIQYYFNII